MKPWIQIGIAAVTGSTLLVGGTLLAAMLVDLVDGTMISWIALKTVLLVMWGIGAVVVGAAYWMHSPRGREIWTAEQREALKNLKDGKI